MRPAGNAGIRFLIAVVVIPLALLVEYAFSDGGVLRWLMRATSTAEVAPAAPEPPVATVVERAAPSEPAKTVIAPPPPPPPPARPQVAATAAAAPMTLPVSSSFEDEQSGWSYDARGGDGIGARTTDVTHSGRYALFSQASESANRGWPGWIGASRLAVAPGRAYVFRAWASSPDGGNAWLDIQLYDRAGTPLGGRSTGCVTGRPGAGWEPLELRYVNDEPGVASVRLSLLQCLNTTAGRTTTLYFDDASFEPVN